MHLLNFTKRFNIFVHLPSSPPSNSNHSDFIIYIHDKRKLAIKEWREGVDDMIDVKSKLQDEDAGIVSRSIG